MKFLTIALVLSTFSMGALANSGGQKAEEIPLAQLIGDFELTSSKPTSVIVEIDELSIIEAKHKGKGQTKANLKSKRGQIISALQGKVSSAEVNREYDYLFSGFSVELPANEIRQLLSVQGVKAVYPNVEYNADVVSAEEISPEAYSPDMMDSAPFIGANEAWDVGYTGEGVTVAVIDTGADYTHPDLADAFGDYKGWDFVDNDDDPQETPVGDPRGEETAHGTHVSGTIAANGYISGVAPDATLLAYRVLGPGGSGTTENVIAGIERAVQDGADVMNLSLGASLNDPDYATSLALDWAMAEGVVAVTSNGNSGPDNWTVGSPGTSRDAISVGATQLPFNVFTSEIFTSEGVEYPSAKVMGHPGDDQLLSLNEGEHEFIYVGLGSVEEFAEKDVEGKIALISRGAYAFVDKATNAKNAGAIGAIIFNSADGEFDFIIPGMAVPTIKLSGIDGQKMLDELGMIEEGDSVEEDTKGNKGNKGKKDKDSGEQEVSGATVEFNIEFSHWVDETVADFSSRGPVMNTWMIKPDVSAPGVNITSTVPTHNPDDPHGYASYQGTSMSAPHVAGAAALVLEANPTWGVDNVKSALMNTAVDVIDPASGESYPHNTQGAGSIRVLDAIMTESLVAPGSHSYGVFDKDKGKDTKNQFFEINNLSDENKTYGIDVELYSGGQHIKVNMDDSVEVLAGDTEDVIMNVQVNASKLTPGYYEGMITISDGTQTIDVPTILFVGEPDYPEDLLTGAYFANAGDGTYDVGSDIPFGADILEYDLYNTDFTAFYGTFGSFADVPGPFHDFSWDGKIEGDDVPPGQYGLAIYVELDGVSEYKGYLITID